MGEGTEVTVEFRALIEYTPFAVRHRYGGLGASLPSIDRNESIRSLNSLLDVVRRQLKGTLRTRQGSLVLGLWSSSLCNGSAVGGAAAEPATLVVRGPEDSALDLSRAGSRSPRRSANPVLSGPCSRHLPRSPHVISRSDQRQLTIRGAWAALHFPHFYRRIVHRFAPVEHVVLPSPLTLAKDHEMQRPQRTCQCTQQSASSSL